jgi:hypothetical protein
MGVIVMAIALPCINACSVSKKPAYLLITKESYCNPPVNLNPVEKIISHNVDSVLSGSRISGMQFSTASIILLHALDLLDDVREIDRLKNDSGAQMQVFKVRQHIQNRIMLANAEIGAFAAELECEGQRVDQIAKYVETMNSKKITRLTVASIVVGAATGIGGALVNNDNWNKGVTIGGGVVGAGLGIAALNPRGRKVELLHKRNPLRNIWLQENNHDISSFLWFMLTEKRISNTGANSLAVNLKHRWVRYQFEGNIEDAAASVNFTGGGIYRAGDLRDRADMIRQLQAEVRSLDQYLNAFLRELQ